MLHIRGCEKSRLALFTLLAALIVAGCAGPSASRAPEPALLQTAATAYLGGDYNGAVTAYTDFLGMNPDSPKAAEAYIGRGNAFLRLERYDLAEADYKNALARTSDKGLKAQATMGLANAAAAVARFADAEALYRQALKSYAGDVPQDEVNYRLALSLARQGKWDDAQKGFEQVVSAWPSGDYARYARVKLAALKAHAFTVQVAAFSKKESADAAARELEAKGFPARIDQIDNDGVALYAVRSGSFSTWQAASEHADKLKAAGFRNFILP